MPKSFTQNLSYVGLIGLLAAAAMAASFYNGVPFGNDMPQHYQFADTIYHSILNGEFYPSWAESPNQGYGDIGLRFYPPLGYYALAASRLLIGNWYNASLLTFFLIFLIGGIGAYLWAQEELPAKESLLAAGFYIFAPYHINQIYNNFLYAEFAATAVLPFCFLYVTRICKKGNVGSVLGLAVSFALLLLTHLPTSIIGSLALFIYALSLLNRKSFFRTSASLSLGIIGGFLASSFYWLRMVTEMDWVRHSQDIYFQERFDYHANFLLFPFHLLNYETDVLALWLADLMNLAMVFLTIPSLILLFRNRRNISRVFLSTGLIFIVSVLMTTVLSRPVWDNLHFLQKVQFPWRWLSVVSLTGAIFAVPGIFRIVEAMNQNKSRLLTLYLGGILLFFAFVSAFVIRQCFYSSREQIGLQMANISSANSFDCWWSIWAQPEAQQIKEKALIAERQVEIVKWNSTERKFNVFAGPNNDLRVATFYYPYWQAKVNGQTAEVKKTSDGAISIGLPPENSVVELSFTEPPFVKTASVISVITWLIFFLGGALLIRKSFKNKNTHLLQTL